MQIKSMKDVVAGLGMAAVGAAFAAGSTAYNFGTSIKPGPGYFPFGLGILLVILGLIIAVNALRGDPVEEEPLSQVPWRALICIAGAIALFGLLLPRLGFVVAFPVMIVLTSYGSTEFKWHEALMSAVVLLAMCWLIFIFGLGLNIPLWPNL
jgi:hypothetical protein